MSYPTGYLTLKDIAHFAGVSRPAVSNWRARRSDFPHPIHESPTRRPLFRIAEVLSWLRENNLLHGGKTGELVTTAIVNGLTQIFPDQLQATQAGLLLLTDPDRGVALVQQAGATPTQVADLRANSVTAAAIPEVATLIVDTLLGVGGRGFYSQFGTSQSASVRLLADAAGTTVTDTVFDPACGIGGILLAMAREHDITLVGADISPTAVDVAKLHADLLGIPADFHCQDSLAAATSTTLSAPDKYQTVVMEAPLDQQADSKHCQKLAQIFDQNATIPARSHEAFLLCALHHIAPDGYGYVLTSSSPGTLPQSAEVRRILLHRHQVEAIIQLPEKFLAYSHMNTLLWVLRGSPTDTVTVVDASTMPKSQLNVAAWLTAIRTGQPLAVPHATLTAAALLADHDGVLPSTVLRDLHLAQLTCDPPAAMTVTRPLDSPHPSGALALPPHGRSLVIPPERLHRPHRSHSTIRQLIHEGIVAYSPHRPATGEYLAVLNDRHAVYPPDVAGPVKFLQVIDSHRFHPQFLAMCINNACELWCGDFKQVTVPHFTLAEQQEIIQSVHRFTGILLGTGKRP